MVIINAPSQIVMVNRQTERVFGHSQAVLIGQPVGVLAPERFRQQHPAHVALFFATASVRPMVAGLPLLGRRKDGVEFEADIALSPISTEAGILAAALVRDVFRRHVAS